MWRKFKSHRLALAGTGDRRLLHRDRHPVLRVLRHPRHLLPRLRLHPLSAAADPLRRRRGPLPSAPVRVPPDHRAQPADLRAGVPRRPRGALSDPPPGDRRRVPPVGPLPRPAASVRHRGGGRVLPVRHRPAGPRSVLPGVLRGAHLALHRLRRGSDQLRTGLHSGRHLRLLRRHRRHADPAHDRVSELDSADPAVDGAGRRDPAELAGAAGLLHDHRDPVDHRLDRPGAGGARLHHRAARVGHGHRGHGGGRQERDRSSYATCCRRS